MTENSSFEEQGITISTYGDFFYEHNQQTSFEN